MNVQGIAVDFQVITTSGEHFYTSNSFLSTNESLSTFRLSISNDAFQSLTAIEYVVWVIFFNEYNPQICLLMMEQSSNH